MVRRGARGVVLTIKPCRKHQRALAPPAARRPRGDPDEDLADDDDDFEEED